MVDKQLQQFLDEVDSLDSFQAAFRPDYGTETILVALVDDLKGECVPVISVAFYTIKHGILLRHQSDLGAGSTVLQLVRSLSGKPQKVLWGNCCSSSWPLR